MKRFVIATLVLALTAGVAAPASAQVTPWPRYGPRYGQPYGVPGTGVGDAQRYEMERVRQQAQESETLARQQALQTRLTLMALQARRQASPAPESPAPVLRALERETAAREAATARREPMARGVGQIDSWLDRPPQ